MKNEPFCGKSELTVFSFFIVILKLVLQRQQQQQPQQHQQQQNQRQKRSILTVVSQSVLALAAVKFAVKKQNLV